MARRTMRVSLALALVDGLTGQPIVRGAQVCIEHGGTAIRKPNGYWVFVNLPVGTCTVTIQAPFYQKKTLLVSIPQEGIITRTALIPNRQYPFAQPVEWWEGTLSHGQPVWAAWEEEPPQLRVMEPFAKGSQNLSFYAAREPGGVQWIWMRTQNGKTGLFEISPQAGRRGEYQLHMPLPWDIDHTTQVVPAIQVDGGETQRYQIPMPHGCKCLYLVGPDGAVLSCKQR